METEQTGRWVVEVRKTNPLERMGNGWSCIAECSDSKRAIDVADAIHNLMQTGIIKSHLLQVRTRLVPRKN